jgi:gamma-glutamyl:cysteine ligase YbdK (ATP-grasp superfamily)
VSADDFADVYNAAQLAAAPIVAVSGNSPYFDGKCLWEETRIALFQQATDTRRSEHARRSHLARVNFGPGFVHDALDLFHHNVTAYEPLMPVVSERETVDGVPALDELRLHQGTIWNWNRAVYDPSCGGHLRIEHRVVASGPTELDMLANVAFTLGLSLGLAPLMPTWLKDLPFAWAEQNLYSAAKHGLDAQIAWPSHRGPSPHLRRASDVVLELLPIAEKGLVRHGVDRDEAADLLAIVKERAESGQTGSAVQRAWVSRFERDLPRPRALARMVGEYLPRSEGELPVHRWRL